MDYQILVLDLDGTLTNSKKDTGRYAAGRTASSGRLRKLYPFF